MADDDPRRHPRNWGLFLGLLLAATAYYQIGNRVFAPGLEEARAHALYIWQLQLDWGLAWEPAAQAAVDSVQIAGVPWLMILLVVFYVGPHFALTFSFFGWAYWKRFDAFASVRNVFLIFTVISFGFQWAYPLAPPRLVPETGLRYTLDEWLPVTGDSPTIMAMTNPYAAFPSVHTGWAFLVAYFAVRLTSSRWRHLWWLYPGTIVLSILATGNHFVLDIVAAVPFIILAFAADAWIRRTATTRPVTGPLPAPIHADGDHSFSGRAQRLAGMPAAPRSLQHPRNWYAGARLFVDYVLTVPRLVNRVASRVRHHPAPFRKHTIHMRDGVALKAWVGIHEGERRPAIMIVPGLFTSKDNWTVRRRAVRAFRSWGFHVMTLDLRGNGESDRVPGTAGWKEAEDLQHVADWFRGRADIDGLGVYAESLAATAAVLAAARAGAAGRSFADRGVLAVSGFMDVEGTIDLYTAPPADATQELKDVIRFFTLLLRASGHPGRTFREYHQAGSAYYGVDATAAAAGSSPLRVVSRLKDPVLVLHSHDDALVPVRQAEAMAEKARHTDHLGVWILPWGHHCLYEMADPAWFWNVLEAFFMVPARAPPEAAGDSSVPVHVGTEAEPA